MGQPLHRMSTRREAGVGGGGGVSGELNAQGYSYTKHARIDQIQLFKTFMALKAYIIIKP